MRHPQKGQFCTLAIFFLNFFSGLFPTHIKNCRALTSTCYPNLTGFYYYFYSTQTQIRKNLNYRVKDNNYKLQCYMNNAPFFNSSRGKSWQSIISHLMPQIQKPFFFRKWSAYCTKPVFATRAFCAKLLFFFFFGNRKCYAMSSKHR